jgi:hypothetical protein
MCGRKRHGWTNVDISNKKHTRPCNFFETPHRHCCFPPPPPPPPPPTTSHKQTPRGPPTLVNITQTIHRKVQSRPHEPRVPKLTDSTWIEGQLVGRGTRGAETITHIKRRGARDTGQRHTQTAHSALRPTPRSPNARKLAHADGIHTLHADNCTDASA